MPSTVPDPPLCPPHLVPRISGPADAMAPGGPPTSEHTMAFQLSAWPGDVGRE